MALSNCPECHNPVSDQAATCPKCGHPLKPAQTPGASATPVKSKSLTVFLALILGGIGAHKFYVDKPGVGLLYLLFCWSFIPSVIGLLEGIQYITMTEEAFQKKYIDKKL